MRYEAVKIFFYLDSAHLLADVVERVGGVDGEADQDDVRIGVRQGPQAVVVFLTSSIP